MSPGCTSRSSTQAEKTTAPRRNDISVDESRGLARVFVVAARRVDPGYARRPLRGEDAIGVAVFRREVADLRIVERGEMPPLDHGELLALGCLDRKGGEEEVGVQVGVEGPPLAGPHLLGAAPARAETDVDDPGATALPLEAAGAEQVDVRRPLDLRIRADRDLPQPEESRPWEARVLRVLRLLVERAPGVAVVASTLDTLEPPVLERHPDLRERLLEMARRPAHRPGRVLLGEDRRGPVREEVAPPRDVGVPAARAVEVLGEERVAGIGALGVGDVHLPAAPALEEREPGL